MSAMKALVQVIACVLLLPAFVAAQEGDEWPPLGYLRNDYREVVAVAHVRIRKAEITGRIGGYENWRVEAEVLESFKGRPHRGDVIEYFHGAEAGLRREYFDGEKIVFLLAERDRETKALRYSVLENSTLPHTAGRARKLRTIKSSDVKRRTRRPRR